MPVTEYPVNLCKTEITEYQERTYECGT
jgi:hypothetical protein